MNDKLLVRRKVNIPNHQIGLLSFIHPNYDIVDNIDDYDNLYTLGIIYTGKFDDTIINKISKFTDNWIIVTPIGYDIDLATNEGLVKNLLPLHYIQLKKGDGKSSKNDSATPVYNEIDYDILIEKVKVCLIDNSSTIKKDYFMDQSVYNLFVAILCTPDILNQQFFTIVNKDNVSYITSSLLTFLYKVQNQSIKGASCGYSRLIVQSYRRYGKYIKQAMIKFIKSKSNKEISLHRLLMFLNRAK